jgi:hypothetical protein
MCKKDRGLGLSKAVRDCKMVNRAGGPQPTWERIRDKGDIMDSKVV